MSPFRFIGKPAEGSAVADPNFAWYIECDPLTESVQVFNSKGAPMSLSDVAHERTVPLQWALQSELRGYRVNMGGYGSVEWWDKKRDLALEALNKYTRKDLTWKVYTP